MSNREFKVDFLGIGAPKSGTTWLTSCLDEHPEIFIPDMKEVCFFHNDGNFGNFHRGINWYSSLFKNAKPNQKLGEYTNLYLISESSPKLIKRFFPNVKLILMLRSPIKLAYSFYWWKRANLGFTRLPDTFEEALVSNDGLLRYGFFARHISSWLKYFPKNRLKIIFLEDFKKNPKKVIKEIFRYLEVDANYIPGSLSKKVNISKQPRSRLLSHIEYRLFRVSKGLGLNTAARIFLSRPRIARIYEKLIKKEFDYPPMKISTKEKLVQIYKDDIEKLEVITNRNLSHWLKV